MEEKLYRKCVLNHFIIHLTGIAVVLATCVFVKLGNAHSLPVSQRCDGPKQSTQSVPEMCPS